MLGTLAEHVSGVDYGALPASTRTSAVRLLQDTVAAGLAGSAVTDRPGLADLARRWGRPGPGGATVWGSGEILPAASAALVNAFFIHRLEYDCVHEEAVLHPMAALLGALFADLESSERPVSGQDFLAAIVAGVDVSARLGSAATGPMRWFRPSALGIFGATVSVARQRNYTSSAVAAACSHAYLQSAGTLQPHAEGTGQLALQIGLAARAALTACDLAELTMRTARDVFTGEYGYFRLFEDSSDTDRVTAGLGEVWAIDRVSQKPFPSGRLTHPAIDAAVQLHSEGWRDAEEISVFVPPLVHRLTARPPRVDMEPGYARLCLPWLVAKSISGGRPRLADFSMAGLSDPVVLRLAERVRIERTSASPSAFGPQVVRVRGSDGRRMQASAELGLGHPDKPMNRSQRKEKFRECGLTAGLTGSALDEIEGRLESLEQSADTRELPKRLVRS